ncbi:DUF2336 domain-containing protein [Pelagibius litoralis]|uniref:DUF2336 domain-containing protein n=1 Tax=Pelagibius litoralis TaxID=374515 RepID=A0A967KGC7_9PROT|nr:DUF2336 domain-containing protein [Pelagibius litoralis]NIA70246.1 DUF2336 domain-containing protein [Pelagibius litoralis]
MMQLSTAIDERPAAPAARLSDALTSPTYGEPAVETADRVGRAFAAGHLSEDERLAAVETFERLARNEEVEVRLALAEHIKGCPFLPHNIARILADDIEAVAVPVLKTSIVLTDEDLLSIIENGNTAKQRAVAGRSTVSETVADALIDTGDKQVVGTLLSNEGAAISGESLHNVIDSYGEETEIQTLMVERQALPITVKERLVTMVSGDLRDRLIGRHGFPTVLVDRLIRHGKERALIQSLSATTSIDEIEAAAMRLFLNGGLTSTLLIRSLCVGRLDIFEICIATLARVPAAQAQRVIAKPNSSTCQELFERSGIPAQLFSAFRIALDVVVNAERQPAAGWKKVDEKKIIDRWVNNYDRLSPENLESVLCQLGRLEGDKA